MSARKNIQTISNNPPAIFTVYHGKGAPSAGGFVSLRFRNFTKASILLVAEWGFLFGLIFRLYSRIFSLKDSTELVKAM